MPCRSVPWISQYQSLRIGAFPPSFVLKPQVPEIAAPKSVSIHNSPAIRPKLIRPERTNTQHRAQSPARAKVNAAYRMPLARLSASRSKAELFQQLGWDEDDDDYQEIYREMMNEAAEARHRMCEEKSNLTNEAQADPTLTKPYAVHHLSEEAQYKEVQNIFATASPETRAVYELGQYSDGLGPFGDRQGLLDNWIIRWCLWHVFRYRDDRNRHRDRAQAAAVVVEIQNTAQTLGATENQERRASIYYDPVRDVEQPLKEPARPPALDLS